MTQIEIAQLEQLVFKAIRIQDRTDHLENLQVLVAGIK